MDYFKYPPLSSRPPLPPLYIPGAYLLYGLTLFIPNKVARIVITLPILLLLLVGLPCYTQGAIADDYGAAAALCSTFFMYIDYLILTPLEGNEVRFVGRVTLAGKGDGGKVGAGVGEDDCATTWGKVKWALRLLTLVRGVGWNVQVKGVPPHPDATSPRALFARKAVLHAARSWLYKVLAVYCMGFALGIKANTTSAMIHRLMDVVVGWGSASWAYHGMNWLYNCAAAATVAIGMCEPWEWPPIFGSLSEAWSVRQMWSVVWHQFLRRLLQQPGIRLANLFGFRKGTCASKYLQLYVAFAISMCYHEWMNFASARHEAGEFRFFMSQAVAITIEDFVQWCWRRYMPVKSRVSFASVSVVLGYAWTFAWFSFSLSPFVKRQLAVGISANGLGDPAAMAYGRQTAFRWQRM